MRKTALITGITGQDGSYLAELLLKLGYRVVGLCRGGSSTKNIDQIINGIELVHGDLRDALSLNVAIHKYRPDELYNLAAQSFVPPSWVKPDCTLDINTNGLLRILEIVEKIVPSCKVYQATSSEMYGPRNGPNSELTECFPNSPYGVSKLASHKLCSVYRGKGLYVVSGILHNHESPRRGIEMVTRKISRHVAEWAKGIHKDPLLLGNIDARRDWGFAGDYVEAMHMMLQQDKPDDYVIGYGIAHSVKEFFEIAVREVFDGKEPEINYFLNRVQTDSRLLRKSDIDVTVADYNKAQRVLGWKPKTTFNQLVEMMVNHDMDIVSRHTYARERVTV